MIGVERLIGSKEFTLLAPNNDAFRSLTPAQLADLLANPTELTDLLKNHLVAEKLTADDLRAMTSVETAAGTHVADRAGRATPSPSAAPRCWRPTVTPGPA